MQNLKQDLITIATVLDITITHPTIMQAQEWGLVAKPVIRKRRCANCGTLAAENGRTVCKACEVSHE